MSYRLRVVAGLCFLFAGVLFSLMFFFMFNSTPVSNDCVVKEFPGPVMVGESYGGMFIVYVEPAQEDGAGDVFYPACVTFSS